MPSTPSSICLSDHCMTNVRNVGLAKSGMYPWNPPNSSHPPLLFFPTMLLKSISEIAVPLGQASFLGRYWVPKPPSYTRFGLLCLSALMFSENLMNKGVEDSGPARTPVSPHWKVPLKMKFALNCEAACTAVSPFDILKIVDSQSIGTK